jgi:hypothetical protein
VRLAATSLETPRVSWVVGCNVRSAQRTIWGGRADSVSVTRLERRKSLIERLHLVSCCDAQVNPHWSCYRASNVLQAQLA